ncbi:MAG: glycosyltransferase family A protein [Chloroflexia bacterium]
MKISAIITTYNYARFLPTAIESVLGQTRVPDEIVVVDDGSTDNTREVVASYAERGVRYVYQPNAGAGAARNRGLRETTGELVAFLDGDDRWLPNKMALQSAHMAQNPGVGLVTGSEWQVYESGEQPYLLRRPPVTCASNYPRILVENTLGNPSLTLIRRECFRTAGMFDETMPLGQDWDMWIRIARSYPIGVVDAPLILFTRHGSSLTASKLVERYKSNRSIQDRYIRKIGNPLARLRLRLSAQSMNIYYTATSLADALAGGHRFQALGMALASALLDPTYETRNKAGLLLRLLLGKRIMSQLHHRRRPLPAGRSTP